MYEIYRICLNGTSMLCRKCTTYSAAVRIVAEELIDDAANGNVGKYAYRIVDSDEE